MIFDTKQTVALNVIAHIRNGRIFWKDKAKNLARHFDFSPSDTFVIFFSSDAEMYKYKGISSNISWKIHF